jgi:RNA polymerase sigma factor (TIGR02999 family)
MDTAYATEITVLLRAWSSGDRHAFDDLIPLVYRKLYAAAQRYMSLQGPGHVLQNTALVNETYLQLAKLGKVDWQNRNHFYAVCAQLMRRILTDHARAQLSAKRGGAIEHVPADDQIAEPNWHAALISLDDALHGLGGFGERMLKIVELRAFVGLSVAETAEALNISESTVKREWQMARVWLLRELSRGKTNGR